MANNRGVITEGTRRNRVELFYEAAAAQLAVHAGGEATAGYAYRLSMSPGSQRRRQDDDQGRIGPHHG